MKSSFQIVLIKNAKRTRRFLTLVFLIIFTNVRYNFWMFDHGGSMMRGLYLLICVGFLGCGTTRKISQVGLRDLASSSQSANVFSELRLRASSLKAMPNSCPAQIKSLYPILASELVAFPNCPKELAEQFQQAMPYLQMQERTTLEEVMNSQCRSMARGQFSESVEGLYSTFDSSGPMGRQKENGKVMDGAAQSILTNLKKGISELVEVHLPLDRWVEKNGNFVLPEDDLSFLHHLLVDKKCKMTTEDLEQSYQSMHALEELEKITPNEGQKDKLDHFLDGVHKVIEQKIREYFYP